MTTLINRTAAAPTHNVSTGRTPAAQSAAAAPAALPRPRGTYTTRYDHPQGTLRAEGTYVSTGRRAVTRPRTLGSYVDTSSYTNRRTEGSYTFCS
ncbi:hypothetical protein [Arthrobacter sp. zg-Y877]|uniref:hypothetical protein n=1 Tax=Arthrobacter sp. zg-Y877 TaxID=3049074 RepID=UPI0025A3341B|nr:hypothetical protein [Arthrobacter sp. zg-Y877]MDM7989143.1 hypothetical protein [Arthrobacter sp. zg-Y877]